MKRMKEYLGILCILYLVVVMAVVPLYTGGTYLGLGDTKYLLFRNVSVLCLGIWLLLAIPGCAMGLIGKKHTFVRISMTDAAVLFYGISVVVAACLSSYPRSAWYGYRDWYVGALSQLIFVGIYFFVSRNCSDEKVPLCFLVGAYFLITVLGIAQRLGWNLPEKMGGFNSGDWEYSHMLSTIGNINWFCEYAAVAVGITLVGYLRSIKRGQQILLYGIVLLGLSLLCIQGCDSGIVIVIICLGFCFVYGISEEEYRRKALLLAGGMFLFLPLYGVVAKLIGKPATLSLPADGISLEVISSFWWLLPAAICFVIVGVGRHFRGKGISLCVVIVLTVFVLVLCGGYLSLLSGKELWASGRGTLWRLSVLGFCRNNLCGKLFGVGPDCFAEYIYSVFSSGELLELEGKWEGAVFANAHNEWLNHLINIGLVGTISYFLIYIGAFARYRKQMDAVLLLVLCGAMSLVGFQQCISTPIFFALLGIFEYRERKMIV